MMLDASSEILYLKSCDNFGKYDIKVYSCKDITNQFISQNTPATISKAEYDNLTSKIDNLTKLLGAKHESNVTESPELDFSGSTVCKSTETNKSKS